ncbi:hypothetical protein, partial [Treponema pallidum]
GRMRGIRPSDVMLLLA